MKNLKNYIGNIDEAKSSYSAEDIAGLSIEFDTLVAGGLGDGTPTYYGKYSKKNLFDQAKENILKQVNKEVEDAQPHTKSGKLKIPKYILARKQRAGLNLRGQLVPGHHYLLVNIYNPFYKPERKADGDMYKILTIGIASSANKLDLPMIWDGNGYIEFSKGKLTWTSSEGTKEVEETSYDSENDESTGVPGIIDLTRIVPEMKKIDSDRKKAEKEYEEKKAKWNKEAKEREEKHNRIYAAYKEKASAGQIKCLGCANGWTDNNTPKEYKDWLALSDEERKNDDWLEIELGRCYRKEVNVSRGWYYTVDSSD